MQMQISSTAAVQSTSLSNASTRESVAPPEMTQSRPVETTTQQAVQAIKPQSEPAEVKDAVAKINKAIQVSGSGLEFSVDAESGINIVKVMDVQTKEVIRQIPSEEAVHIAQALDKLQGLLVRDKA